MFETEIKKYEKLNALADNGGTVIFGGGEDEQIPLCELKQAFSLEDEMYNRSFDGLSVKNAAKLYDECVLPIAPAQVILHIGAADKELFDENPVEFDRLFCELICHIKADGKVGVTVVSVKNAENDPILEQMNRHMQYIAKSENCEYGDVREQKSDRASDISAFIHSTGFFTPLRGKRPMYDLVKILF